MIDLTGGTSLQIIVKACKVLLKFVLLDLEHSRESHQPLKVTMTGFSLLHTQIIYFLGVAKKKVLKTVI